MFKYFKAASVAVTVVVFNCVLLPARADGPLNAPSLSAGQFGANRRVISSREGYTAVRGKFAIPIIKVSPMSAVSTRNLANSKPSFYLGVSRTGSVEVDAGVQYEWEAIKFKNTDGSITTTNPGWSIFVNADINGRSIKTNPLNGWRGGPGTRNETLTGFDLTWATRRNFRSGIGGVPIATPGYYGYLEVFAVGVPANGQPLRNPSNRETSSPNCRLVPSRDGVAETITDAVTNMAVKRVVCITQGGSYGKIFSNTTTTPGIESQLKFPSVANGLYDEDGSYMRNAAFSEGQVAFEVPVPARPSPSWQNWSDRALNSDRPSVDQTSSNSKLTGYYPGGTDRTIVPSPGGAGGKARGSLPYFVFPSLPDLPPNTNDPGNFPSRYNSEIIDINLRAGIPVTGVRVSPGGKDVVSN